MVPRAAAFDKRVKAVAVNAILPNYFKHWLDEALEQVPGVFSGFLASRLEALSVDAWNKWSSLWPGKGMMRASSFR